MNVLASSAGIYGCDEKGLLWLICLNVVTNFTACCLVHERVEMFLTPFTESSHSYLSRLSPLGDCTALGYLW